MLMHCDLELAERILDNHISFDTKVMKTFRLGFCFCFCFVSTIANFSYALPDANLVGNTRQRFKVTLKHGTQNEMPSNLKSGVLRLEWESLGCSTEACCDYSLK